MIILGFNDSQMRDASACIARDGELLFAVAKECISRVKHDAGFPQNAIRGLGSGVAREESVAGGAAQ